MEQIVVETLTFQDMADWIMRHKIPLAWIGGLVFWVLINLMTYNDFKQDKKRAISGDRRIPENSLLFGALIGGTLGAKIAQRRFRHKTRKEPFRTLLNLICSVHLTGLAVFAIWWLGYLPTVLDWLR
ncbi:DUF1294 domain-containing protein [Octadecabacter sp. G9-8]|uniref:DUF1294 domain-containing protein n=1 Tax=Octadecabacter dasysiphoniae TaxID=2909341 RepID=A0ABS9CVU5_9RHOB|nr:DUF1294 domain-containing protein [Octadecabacter dasysiphoniae]MCF2871061.1 DUF1294 domain-containing protein [Octadecabacter dasysiphoniae]